MLKKIQKGIVVAVLLGMVVAILSFLYPYKTAESSTELRYENITIIREDKVYKLAKAIQLFEGYHEGSRSYVNNNPGNLRNSPFKTGMLGGFAYFDTYEQGFDALMYQIRISAEGRSGVYRPEMTLLEFFNVYAPSSDNNQPNVYYNNVMEHTGFDRGMTLAELI